MRMAGAEGSDEAVRASHHPVIRGTAKIERSTSDWEAATALWHKRGGELSRSVKSTIRC